MVSDTVATVAVLFLVVCFSFCCHWYSKSCITACLSWGCASH